MEWNGTFPGGNHGGGQNVTTVKLEQGCRPRTTWMEADLMARASTVRDDEADAVWVISLRLLLLVVW
jgi:hypothetical protein